MAKPDRYAAAVYHCLEAFRKATEWSDFVRMLDALSNTLEQHSSDYIPHYPLLIKRLVQCLHPVLPKSVHACTLRVYSTIFQKLPEDALVRDFSVLTCGLLAFGADCSIIVLPEYLAVLESHILPVAPRVPDAAGDVMMAILPAVESEASEFFAQGLALLMRLYASLPRPVFFEALWGCFNKRPHLQVPIVNFLLRIRTVEIPDYRLVTRAYCRGLFSTSPYVVRTAMELSRPDFPHNLVADAHAASGADKREVAPGNPESPPRPLPEEELIDTAPHLGDDRLPPPGAAQAAAQAVPDEMANTDKLEEMAVPDEMEEVARVTGLAADMESSEHNEADPSTVANKMAKTTKKLAHAAITDEILTVQATPSAESLKDGAESPRTATANPQSIPHTPSGLHSPIEDIRSLQEDSISNADDPRTHTPPRDSRPTLVSLIESRNSEHIPHTPALLSAYNTQLVRHALTVFLGKEAGMNRRAFRWLNLPAQRRDEDLVFLEQGLRTYIGPIRDDLVLFFKIFRALSDCEGLAVCLMERLVFEVLGALQALQGEARRCTKSFTGLNMDDLWRIFARQFQAALQGRACAGATPNEFLKRVVFACMNLDIYNDVVCRRDLLILGVLVARAAERIERGVLYAFMSVVICHAYAVRVEDDKYSGEWAPFSDDLINKYLEDEEEDLSSAMLEMNLCRSLEPMFVFDSVPLPLSSDIRLCDGILVSPQCNGHFLNDFRLLSSFIEVFGLNCFSSEFVERLAGFLVQNYRFVALSKQLAGAVDTRAQHKRIYDDFIASGNTEIVNNIDITDYLISKLTEPSETPNDPSEDVPRSLYSDTNEDHISSYGPIINLLHHTLPHGKYYRLLLHLRHISALKDTTAFLLYDISDINGFAAFLLDSLIEAMRSPENFTYTQIPDYETIKAILGLIEGLMIRRDFRAILLRDAPFGTQSTGSPSLPTPTLPAVIITLALTEEAPHILYGRDGRDGRDGETAHTGHSRMDRIIGRDTALRTEALSNARTSRNPEQPPHQRNPTNISEPSQWGYDYESNYSARLDNTEHGVTRTNETEAQPSNTRLPHPHTRLPIPTYRPASPSRAIQHHAFKLLHTFHRAHVPLVIPDERRLRTLVATSAADPHIVTLALFLLVEDTEFLLSSCMAFFTAVFEAVAEHGREKPFFEALPRHRESLSVPVLLEALSYIESADDYPWRSFFQAAGGILNDELQRIANEESEWEDAALQGLSKLTCNANKQETHSAAPSLIPPATNYSLNSQNQVLTAAMSRNGRAPAASFAVSAAPNTALSAAPTNNDLTDMHSPSSRLALAALLCTRLWAVDRDLLISELIELPRSPVFWRLLRQLHFKADLLGALLSGRVRDASVLREYAAVLTPFEKAQVLDNHAALFRAAATYTMKRFGVVLLAVDLLVSSASARGPARTRGAASEVTPILEPILFAVESRVTSRERHTLPLHKDVQILQALSALAEFDQPQLTSYKNSLFALLGMNAHRRAALALIEDQVARNATNSIFPEAFLQHFHGAFFAFGLRAKRRILAAVCASQFFDANEVVPLLFAGLDTSYFMSTQNNAMSKVESLRRLIFLLLANPMDAFASFADSFVAGINNLLMEPPAVLAALYRLCTALLLRVRHSYLLHLYPLLLESTMRSLLSESTELSVINEVLRCVDIAMWLQSVVFDFDGLLIRDGVLRQTVIRKVTGGEGVDADVEGRFEEKWYASISLKKDVSVEDLIKDCSSAAHAITDDIEPSGRDLPDSRGMRDEIETRAHGGMAYETGAHSDVRTAFIIDSVTSTVPAPPPAASVSSRSSSSTGRTEQGTAIGALPVWERLSPDDKAAILVSKAHLLQYAPLFTDIQERSGIATYLRSADRYYKMVHRGFMSADVARAEDQLIALLHDSK